MVELSGPPALRLGFRDLVPYQYGGACRVRLPFAWVLVSWVPTSVVAFIGCHSVLPPGNLYRMLP